MNWPPPYSIRTSKRAKYARLSISADKGLVVVLPVGMGKRYAKELLDLRRDWVTKHLNKMPAPAAPEPPPTSIHLPATGETLDVIYQPAIRNSIRVREDTAVHINGPLDDLALVHAGLQTWLKHKAKIVLGPWLEQLSHDIELPYQRLSVRLQKSRWGSCSSLGNINLNAKLLLVEPELVRHVMIHELCHTVHMNHSQAFWDLVADHDSDWVRLRKDCQARWRDMPQWVSG